MPGEEEREEEGVSGRGRKVGGYRRKGKGCVSGMEDGRKSSARGGEKGGAW